MKNPAGSVITTWREPRSGALAEECDRNAVRREFALKLELDQLLTLVRRHQWNAEWHSVDRCPRYESRESETRAYYEVCRQQVGQGRKDKRRSVRGRVAGDREEGE